MALLLVKRSFLELTCVASQPVLLETIEKVITRRGTAHMHWMCGRKQVQKQLAYEGRLYVLLSSQNILANN